ncbi:DUF2190 family protein [Cereibacter johrii]|uniref:DUF2190 family protein n=1 Tax=Cereibacter johrii TaxID=445629 RepID=UPI002B2576D3|nr:DUF2190 family protein [Cereibacter johrii]MEA5159978.1 DUF2190 family protein [Cereibacter johrii]
MKTYIQSGDVLTITAPAAVSSGAFVKVGRLIGFAQADAEEGAPVAVVTKGVFTATVMSEVAVSVGDAVYTTADGELTTAESEGEEPVVWHMLVGYATAVAATVGGVATVSVRLA